jgi:hypothetical protein
VIRLEVVVWITFIYDYDDEILEPTNVIIGVLMAFFGVWLVMKI